MADRAWPQLPGAGELVRLPLPCPPDWPAVLGYRGSARLVAVHWTGGAAAGDVWLEDGSLATTGW